MSLGHQTESSSWGGGGALAPPHQFSLLRMAVPKEEGGPALQPPHETLS